MEKPPVPCNSERQLDKTTGDDPVLPTTERTTNTQITAYADGHAWSYSTAHGPA